MKVAAMKKIRALLVVGCLIPGITMAAGNMTNDSFSKAKRWMQQKIYVDSNLRKTIYCGASFDTNKRITLPDGFTTTKYLKRQYKWEAEHVVAAENFGRTFKAWREGDPKCVNSKGKSFKGRNCASKVSEEYRYMQADLYNLFPAIGSVNAARQNYNFTVLPGTKSLFGSCDMHIQNHKVQPPEAARGRIARTHLYFDAVYPRYTLSAAQRKLMIAWDKQYPVSSSECEIGKRVKAIQHSSNPILEARCNY
ncbi:endonuclease [Vibrio salinus]|uniref:endonuclease n=1 Tax=Vibrio salinus TaxID=2899784 RepID=UPI001E54AC5A|nr:endonuclease [Vibrio salinus]MCE0495788.1 endonuclease [Vibrio salinus]